MARIQSLNILLTTEGKMLLAEAYKGVIENIQKKTVSGKLKNTDLSGDPTTGSVEAKRFANASSKAYGTARTAGKGDAVEGETVDVKINKDREFVEEVEKKDVTLLGVDGLIAKRSANHALRFAAELDEDFFAEAVTAGTEFTPDQSITEYQEIVEAAIVQLEKTNNDFIDGIDRELMHLAMSEDAYSKMRNYLDKVTRSNVDTSQESFFAYHGVETESVHRLPDGVDFVLQVKDSIAQPVMSDEYQAEKIPLSNAYGIELFFHYGTKAVTPETILYYAP